MDDYHRKIELQAPADLTFLRDNITATAQQKLDLHIPPSAAPENEEDEFRNKVEELVHQYIHRTLTLALPSISINGFDPSPSQLDRPGRPGATVATGETAEIDPSNPIDPNNPAYEPYDSRLATRLRELYASLETETTRVAELRRDAPAAAARGFVERLSGEIDAADKEFDARAAAAAAAAAAPSGMRQVEQEQEQEQSHGVLDDEGVVIVGLERAERVKETWNRGRKGLEDLSAVTEVVGRLERARRAAEEVTGR